MSKELDNKITFSINEDEILKGLQLEYDVYPLLTIDEYHLKEQLERNPFYQEQWRLLVLKEKCILAKLEIMLGEKTGQLYDTLKNHSDVTYTARELERYYIPKDPELLKIRKLMLKVEVRMQFFEAVHDAFKTQQWMFKNYIESMR